MARGKSRKSKEMGELVFKFNTKDQADIPTHQGGPANLVAWSTVKI
jgi:hypothetical protein